MIRNGVGSAKIALGVAALLAIVLVLHFASPGRSCVRMSPAALPELPLDGSGWHRSAVEVVPASVQIPRDFVRTQADPDYERWELLSDDHSFQATIEWSTTHWPGPAAVSLNELYPNFLSRRRHCRSWSETIGGHRAHVVQWTELFLDPGLRVVTLKVRLGTFSYLEMAGATRTDSLQAVLLSVGRSLRFPSSPTEPTEPTERIRPGE